jgi:hypothetical protein
MAAVATFSWLVMSIALVVVSRKYAEPLGAACTREYRAVSRL